MPFRILFVLLIRMNVIPVSQDTRFVVSHVRKEDSTVDEKNLNDVCLDYGSKLDWCVTV